MASPLFSYPKQCFACHQWICEQRFCSNEEVNLSVAMETELLKLDTMVIHVTCPKLPPVPYYGTANLIQEITQTQHVQESIRRLSIKSNIQTQELPKTLTHHSNNSNVSVNNFTNLSLKPATRPNVAMLPQSYINRFQAPVTTAQPLQKPASDYQQLSASGMTLEDILAQPGATMEQYIKTGLSWNQMKRLLQESANNKKNNYYVLRLFVDHLKFNFTHLYLFFNLTWPKDALALTKLIVNKDIDFSRTEWLLLGITISSTPKAQIYSTIGLTYPQWMNIREY